MAQLHPGESASSQARGARILGVGAAQPAGAVTSAELGAPFGRTAEWVEARTGIRSLRRLARGQSLLDLALASGRDALADAGIDAATLDLIIVTTCTTRAGAPALGPQLGQRLAARCPVFDLNAACSGFSYAVGVADSMIRIGAARMVLIVSAEHMSDVIDAADLGTSIIFGDGAGAAVLGPVDDDEVCIGPVVWGSDGGQADLIAFGDDGLDEYMRMKGRQVFRWAVESVPAIAAEACARAGVGPADIDVFVPHQANLRIIDAVVRKLGMARATIATDVTESGNTSSASIPIALTRLRENGRAAAGQLALLVGFGAGLAFAAQVVRLP